jgi:hypothetical protein
MKKIFNKTNCLILAVAILVQSFGLPLMGQTIKVSQASSATTTDTGSSTKTVLYVAIGVCLAAAITATIIVLAKKNKTKKKVSTTNFINPMSNNFILHDKYAVENFTKNEIMLVLPKSYTKFELVKVDFSSKAIGHQTLSSNFNNYPNSISLSADNH